MTTMFVRHKVADFAAWKQVYDDFDPTRQNMGVTGHGVYRGDENPNEVTVTHDFATAAAAKEFAQSAALADAMEKAGVVGEPTIWFADRA